MDKEREKITALITCFNEEENIRECLESVTWADEIFVVDSFSTDRTLNICREFPTRIEQHEYACTADQMNWAIPRATHPWVLIVDSDERVPPALRERIEKILKDPGALEGYRINRRTFFFGKLIHHCGWERDYVVRLFRKDRGRYEERKVHATMIIDGTIGTIKEHFIHYTYRTFEEYFEKFGRFTTWAAQDLQRKGKRATFVRIFFRPVFRFVKMYFLRRGFLDGLHGLILCGLAAFSVFTKYAKLWDMQRRRDAGV
jgi:glycosyltransferase involved in cell wall biosynthesis